jgi:acyl-CoA dehydrogenase
MDLSFSERDEAFRVEVRSFLAAELTPTLRAAGRTLSGIYADYEVANAWHRILARRGWSVPAWPVEYGGTGWSPVQLYIFERELAAADAPPITPNSTHMVAPVIMAFGTPEQKARYLPVIRSGDDWWAQGYSESSAGSDLAALRCAAVRDGDSYVINGSKIWTTHAHFSNRIFCLVRTRSMERPQQGISFLLFDLDLPGITIRPIRSISGEHELNEIFFDDVRVPASAMLGTEDQGWAIAKYLLQHERMHLWSPLIRARFDRAIQRAQEIATSAGVLLDHPAFAHRAAELEISLMTLEVSELRALSRDNGGLAAAAVPSAMKIVGTELRQDINEFILDLDGVETLSTLATDGHSRPGAIAMATHLNDRAASIYAGTNEVQRDIVAKALLA